MGTEAFYGDLASSVALTGPRAVLRIVATYQPAGGAGSKVFPPTYPTRDSGSPYLLEPRMVRGQERRDVLLDSTPSQANRAEEALLRARRAGVVQLPLFQVEHSGDTDVVLTSLEFPHRYADAYLRDSSLDGVAFDKTDLGKSLLAASLQDVTALYTHDPGSLVYGAWNSHRKGRQQKFPRVYASEVIGWDPTMGQRNAGRMDPLNLQGAQKPAEARPKARRRGTTRRYPRRPRERSSARSGTGTSPPTPSMGASRSPQLSAWRPCRWRALIGWDSARSPARPRWRRGRFWLRTRSWRIGWPSADRACGCAADANWSWNPNAWSGSTEAAPWRRSTCQRSSPSSCSGWRGSTPRSRGCHSMDTISLRPSKALAQAIDFSLTKASSGRVNP